MPGRNAALVALGEAVRQLREEQRLTPAEFAEAAGLDLDHIEAIEQGEHDPDYDVLMALADGLEVPNAALVNRAAFIESRENEEQTR